LAISLPLTAARRSGWRTRAIYGDGVSHHDQQVFLLRLAPAGSADGLPRPLGEPVRLTEGGGLSHTHSGGWSPDSQAIVYTKDTDHGDIYVIENYE